MLVGKLILCFWLLVLNVRKLKGNESNKNIRVLKV